MGVVMGRLGTNTIDYQNMLSNKERHLDGGKLP